MDHAITRVTQIDQHRPSEVGEDRNLDGGNLDLPYRCGGPADLQVAAQVLCLREMFDAPVPVGVVFAGRDRRRYEVEVDDILAAHVGETADALRTLMADGSLPPPVNDKRCRRCSLRPGCEPAAPAVISESLFRPRQDVAWEIGARQ